MPERKDETTGEGERPAVPRRRPLWQRLWPLALLAALAAVVYFSGALDYLSWSALRENLTAMQSFARERTILGLLVLIGVYAAGTAISVPGMSIVTIAAGVVYGLWLGTLGVVIGATLGATAIFLVARTAVGEPLRRRAGPWLKRFEAGFRKDEFNYLLAMRLIPVFPFWLLNIAPALLGMRLKSYALATFFGIIPGTFVYVWVGKGAATAIKKGGRVDPGELLFEPHVIGPILALAALALLPVLVRKIRGRLPGEAGGRASPPSRS